MPTFDTVFADLCHALQATDEDHQPLQMECQTLLSWYAKGEKAPAWRRALVLLEGVLGVPLRGDGA